MKMKLHISNKKRICRICLGDIEPNTEGIILHTYISPRNIDLHFHTKCLIDAVDNIQ